MDYKNNDNQQLYDISDDPSTLAYMEEEDESQLPFNKYDDYYDEGSYDQAPKHVETMTPPKNKPKVQVPSKMPPKNAPAMQVKARVPVAEQVVEEEDEESAFVRPTNAAHAPVEKHDVEEEEKAVVEDKPEGATTVEETKVDEDPVEEDNTADQFSNTESIADDLFLGNSKDEDDGSESEDDEIITDRRRYKEDKYIIRNYKFRRSGSNAILDDLNNIDLTNLNIGEAKRGMRQMDDIDIAFDRNKKSGFSVICAQSGYRATLSALTLADTNAITDTSADNITLREMLFKTVYSKIIEMNIPKPNYKKWLEMTAFADFETLLFGIFCQTYPDSNDYTLTCPHCGKEISVKVPNESLIEVKDRSVYGRMDDITFGSHINQYGEQTGYIDPDELLASSPINTYDRIMLPNSKIIVDIYNPTLADFLNLLKVTNPKAAQKYAAALGSLLYIRKMYMPDFVKYKETGEFSVYEITGIKEKLNILLSMSTTDGNKLESLLNDRMNKYAINYAINSTTCTSCGKEISQSPVNVEAMLFRRIIQRTA